MQGRSVVAVLELANTTAKTNSPEIVILPMDSDSMDAETEPSDRGSNRKSTITIAVNGQKLQLLRQQAGLTQEQLAKKSGYSDRLIRKAEASGRLRKSTIGNLAKALSTNHQKVTAEELTFSNESLARELVQWLLNSPSSNDSPSFSGNDDQHRVAVCLNDSLTSLLADSAHMQLTLHVFGEEFGIPFAGCYEGAHACDSFRKRLALAVGPYQLLTEQTLAFSAPEEVCIRCTTEIQNAVPSSTTGTVRVWWFMTVKFEANLIRRMELLYDTGIIWRLLTRENH